MAALIIEISNRHSDQFFRIDKPVLRVGRALDNDIILSDPSVSPYHFLIRRNATGEHELHSLADENGIRIRRTKIRDSIKLTELPLEFDAGRTRVRILHPSQAVAPTRLISCRNGSACLFGHWGWALILFATLMLLTAADNYLSTWQVLSWESYGHDQLIIAIASLGLSVGLMGINRVTSQRWDYSSSLSFTSLILIVALLIQEFVQFADYYLTSPLPGFIASMVWIIFVVPMAMGWFLIRLNHGSTATSILLIIMLFSPIAYLQIQEVVRHYDLLNTFSKRAYYSDSLYPWDTRIKRSISIDEFAQRSMSTLLPVSDSN